MITFYDPRDEYGPFSNFSRYGVRIYDRVWATSEHAFQAMKFHPHRPDLFDVVHAATTPGRAAKLGRDRAHPLRPDWDSHPQVEMMVRLHGLPQPDDGINRQGVKAEPLFVRVKDVIMFDVVKTKFTQHPQLRDMLVGTGDAVIVEDAMHDPYWGWGSSRIGENKLGRILMLVREQLKA